MAPVMPLQMAPEGKELRVTSINAGRGLTRRLIEMGFNERALVKVLNSHGRGALIVQLNDARFAISRGMAMKIMVDVA
ncbi:MAG: ferrous iron transport protein A [Thermoplasmata archaeon]|nr:ferrous iron transport protein A [Thermoplasmata archaeon]